ncbi:MAG: hypothetical protein ABIV11_05245 [Gemmatimonadaceae bacterium]
MISLRRRCLLLVPFFFGIAPAVPVAAQATRTSMLDYATGSEFEDYLRALQVAGLTESYPWSIRGFSRREIKRLAAADTAGPWRLSAGLKLGGVTLGPITLRATVNSSYPYAANDGPVWAGRGLTTAISAGIAGGAGPLSVVLAPLAFRAENSGFELLDNGAAGLQRFAHGIVPGSVDLPQRFGDQPYSRLDPGASTVRFDSRLVTFGVSTAIAWIGPATEYPFLLGTNAPGFPHVFIGTGGPVNLWVARAHARVAWGKLYQSDYSPVTGSERYMSSADPGRVRLATHATLVVIPRGVPGLEVGFARFLHVPYDPGQPGAEFWKKPFKVFFLENEYAQGDSAGLDNQLASAFFRWVFPGSGFEVFGERGYEDQFHDLRDFLQTPDHLREYLVGFQKVWKRRPGSLHVLKAEIVNYQLAAIARTRGEGGVYTHGTLRQGHTNRGQLLGASAGTPNAAASTLSWTRYTPGYRTALTVRRIVRAERGNYSASGTADPRSTDVIMATGVERMRFGKHVDFGAKVEAMQNFNRNFSRNVPNLNLQLTARLKPW